MDKMGPWPSQIEVRELPSRPGQIKEITEIRNMHNAVICTLERHEVPQWLVQGGYRRVGQLDYYHRQTRHAADA